MLFMINEATEPAFNLAAEEYLLRHCGEDCCMLWQNHNAIIVGRNQNTRAQINPDFVARHGTTVVRRLSGGGTVYHDLGNVNFTFIKVRVARPAIDFQRFAQPILEQLQALGLAVALDGRNDLVLNGRKVSGNAQHIEGHKVLHHGTLLFDVDLDKLGESLRVDAAKYRDKAVASIRSRVTNLRPHLKEPRSVTDFMTDLLTGLRRRFSGREAVLTATDRGAIQALAEEKYAGWDWNFGHSPPYTLRKSTRISGGTVEVLLDVDRGIIRQARLFGDFFGVLEIAGLEQALIGCEHRADALTRRLAKIPVDDYLNGCNGKDLLDALF